MGYSTIVEVDLLLAQAITNARPNANNQKTVFINVETDPSNPIAVNSIPDDVVQYYISLADSQIDGILSQMYRVPLNKCARGQWDLDADINEYNQTVELSDACNLVPGDEIVIRNDDTGTEERHTVATVVDQHTITTLNPIDTFFTADETRVFRLAYPPPINQISARYASSFIYDKYFAAQNDPNVSDFGKEQRSIAMGQINDILNGRTTLWCQHRMGDIFGNAYLNSNHSLNGLPWDFDTNSRDMSRGTK